MAHHGWVTAIDPNTVTPNALASPFGRLFPTASHTYNSHGISLLAGALGPIHKLNPDSGKAPNPAGFTFLGQFIDHDLTEFRVIGENNAILPHNPEIGRRQNVLQDGAPTTANGRTGRFDLDSVYGLLGVPRVDLFDSDGLFRMTDNRDIIRDAPAGDGRLIADPRNDENKIIVQLHLLFERLHNILHREAIRNAEPAERIAGGAVFAETQKRVQKIYRRIVINDYLSKIVPVEVIVAVTQALSDNRALYSKMTEIVRAELRGLGVPDDIAKSSVAMPVEFAHAAFRMGHTQLRPGYRLNTANEPLPLFATGQGEQDLRGNEPITPDLQIDWTLFFNVGDTPALPGEPIDSFLPEAVFRLPPPSVGEPPISLAERNIRRGVDFGLPSGQEALAKLNEIYGAETPLRPATADELFPEAFRRKFKEILAVEPGFMIATPLWYYIIKEAEQTETSELGPVGAHICAETILGSLYIKDSEFVQSEARAMVQRPLQASAAIEPDQIRTMAQMIKFILENE